MIGFGFSAAQPARRRGGSTPSTPPPAPAYLPTLGTAGASYHAVYSNERLIRGYAGALVSTTGGDLGSGGTGVSAAAVASARGAADAVRANGWYDQSGHARHAAAASPAECPGLREDVTIGAALAMAFDGQRQGDSRGPQARRLTAPTAMSAAGCTIAYVIDPTVSVQHQYYFELLDATNSATAIGHLQYPGSAFGGVLPDVHANIAINGGGVYGRNAGRKIATVPQVILLRSRSDALEVFIDGSRIATLAPVGGTTGNLSIGMSAVTAALEAYIPTFRLGAFVTVDTAVNDTDVAAISTALMTRFAIATTYDAVVVNLGSSRVAGTSLSTMTRTKAWFERTHYRPRRIRTYNFAQDAKTISGCHDDRALYDFAVFDPARPIIYVIDDPINDLGGLGPSTDPAAIYATFAAYRNALMAQGANVRVVFATCLPQRASAYARSNAAIDADRVTLNALIRANAAGASAIADPAGSTVMGAYPASTDDAARYPDKLHPSSAGYELLAPYNPAAVATILP